MAIVKPFKGIKPVKDKVHLVASRSVDGYSNEEIANKISTNPYTFLHVIKPEFVGVEKSKPNSPELLQKIKKAYQSFIANNILEQDTSNSYYIYRQTKNNTVFTGIIGCSAIDDYLNGVIKVHEQTLTDREIKLKEYLAVCDFNAEPICMSYPDDNILSDFIKKITQQPAEFNFTTTDTSLHQLWTVSKNEDVTLIEERFKSMPAIYIADGHHRSASSALLGKEKRNQLKNYTGDEGFNYFMCIYFPESELKIYDFNRVVKDLNNLTAEDLLAQIGIKFDIEKKGNTIYKPIQLHNISMYLDGNWYSLTAKKEICNDSDSIGILDASILSEHILSPILNITDLKTSKRIGFVSGIKGMQELKMVVDNQSYKIAFALYPATMEQVKNIANTGKSMPPKTTWVEPKLRSGLVIYSLS